MTGRRLKVLVVDDHVDTCEIVTDLLIARGFEVSAHVTAGAALAAVASFVPEAMLVDVELPDLDGLELVRKLRARVGHSARIVVLTGHVLPDIARRAGEAGANMFLGKPVTSERLVEALLGSQNDLT